MMIYNNYNDKIHDNSACFTSVVYYLGRNYDDIQIQK